MKEPTVLLSNGLDQNAQPITIRGTPFYITGETGVADSIQAVERAGLVRVPAYWIAEGQTVAPATDPVWTQWYDSYGERDTIVDKRGILGTKDQVYVVDFQNGGMFTGNHQRIRTAVKDGKLQNNAIPLDQENDVNSFLDAVAQNDTAVLQQRGLVREGSVYVFKSFEEFDEASSHESFLGNFPAYVVLRTAERARNNLSGHQPIDAQRENEDLIVPLGGRNQLGKVLDLAASFKWTQFGSYHDGYINNNSGRVVLVCDLSFGVSSGNVVINYGRSLGVAPEALVARATIVESVPLEVVVKLEAAAQEVRMVPEDHVRKLLTEEVGLRDDRVGSLLEKLAMYQTK